MYASKYMYAFSYYIINGAHAQAHNNAHSMHQRLHVNKWVYRLNSNNYLYDAE